MQGPWDDWIPGVLNRPQMEVLCRKNLFQLNVPFDPAILDESSIDLHLTGEAYEMLKGSVKPSRECTYREFLDQAELAEKLKPSQGGTYSLEARKTYVFKLRERLGRQLADLRIFGRATAKSSVGRVDVLARLIVDGMDTYECFDPKSLDKGSSGSGEMYLEVTPITFKVEVKADISLSQLRLFYGEPRHVEVTGGELFRAVFGEIGKTDGSLAVKISDTDIGGLPAAAFCADSGRTSALTIPLWTPEGQKRGSVDPMMCWGLRPSSPTGRLEIQAEKFYILRSRERISLPGGIAVYCRASDETIGEMRIHYAGFVHPWFGRRREKGKGTPLIFEVRGHQVNVSLADGERMANLTFYRMSEDAPEPTPSPYENQELELSKFFAQWPTKLKYKEGTDDGAVEAG
jgi:dCTP deaminase